MHSFVVGLVCLSVLLSVCSAQSGSFCSTPIPVALNSTLKATIAADQVIYYSVELPAQKPATPQMLILEVVSNSNLTNPNTLSIYTSVDFCPAHEFVDQGLNYTGPSPQAVATFYGPSLMPLHPTLSYIANVTTLPLRYSTQIFPWAAGATIYIAALFSNPDNTTTTSINITADLIDVPALPNTTNFYLNFHPSSEHPFYFTGQIPVNPLDAKATAHRFILAPVAVPCGVPSMTTQCSDCGIAYDLVQGDVPYALNNYVWNWYNTTRFIVGSYPFPAPDSWTIEAVPSLALPATPQQQFTARVVGLGGCNISFVPTVLSWLCSQNCTAPGSWCNYTTGVCECLEPYAHGSYPSCKQNPCALMPQGSIACAANNSVQASITCLNNKPSSECTIQTCSDFCSPNTNRTACICSAPKSGGDGGLVALWIFFILTLIALLAVVGYLVYTRFFQNRNAGEMQSLLRN